MINNERKHTDLKTSDFYYDLPAELIAQSPAEKRDMSRLLVIDRQKEGFEHRRFHDVTEYLNPGDVLVINDSKVIPARLLGKSERTGSGVELLLLRPRPGDRWEALVRPGKRMREGDAALFGDGLLRAVTEEITEDGNRVVRLEYDSETPGGFYALLDRIGSMPLPPYITKKPDDPGRYQTVYARERGSAAAPTAGLHFTPELLDAIRAKGIAVVPILLHVGLGTFRPVKEERIEDHIMHSEYFSVTKEAADTINARRAAGGRIVAVGTTCTRVLESTADEAGVIHPCTDETKIFIYPPYRFRAVDALITNFHLPESTLLMLVSAFAGREKMLAAYEEAIRERYRFFSFGDACLIE